MHCLHENGRFLMQSTSISFINTFAATKKLHSHQSQSGGENKRAAKSLESFHCKTSFRLRKKRGRERDRASPSVSLFRRWRRRNRRRRGEAHDRKRLSEAQKADDDERKIGTDAARSRTGDRGRRRKGETPTTNTFGEEEEDAMEEPDTGS